MAQQTWFTLDDAVVRAGLKRLASMTNEKPEAAMLGVVPIGGQTVWTTPFFRCAQITVFVNDVAQTSGVTLNRGTGTNGEDQVTFSSSPTAGKTVTATTSDGVLLTTLLNAIVEGQAMVTAAMVGRSYVRPAMDEVAVAPYDRFLPKAWAWTIAEWKLTMGLKRAPLGDAFKTIDAQYHELVGGDDLEGRSHESILEKIDKVYVLNWPKVDPSTGGSLAIFSNAIEDHPRLYDEISYLGV